MQKPAIDLNVKSVTRDELRSAIETIMARFPVPNDHAQVMKQFESKQFCLGLMSGLLMLADHPDVPQTLTSHDGNLRMMALLANVAKAGGMIARAK